MQTAAAQQLRNTAEAAASGARHAAALLQREDLETADLQAAAAGIIREYAPAAPADLTPDAALAFLRRLSAHLADYAGDVAAVIRDFDADAALRRDVAAVPTGTR